MLGNVFNEVLYRPILNGLVFFYEITGDLGIAIILITIVIKIILFPLSKKQLESQGKIKKIQPKIQELKEKYKDDKEKQSRELMELYKKEGINPAAGCLPILIQLPVLIALYRTFIPGRALQLVEGSLTISSGMLYALPFLAQVTSISPMFLGFLDLTQRSIGLAVISSGLQFLQSKMMLGKNQVSKEPEKKKEDNMPDFQEVLGKQMTYLMPVMTFFFGVTFPAALPLYWTVSTIMSIIQQKVLEWTMQKKAEAK